MMEADPKNARLHVSPAIAPVSASASASACALPPCSSEHQALLAARLEDKSHGRKVRPDSAPCRKEYGSLIATSSEDPTRVQAGHDGGAGTSAAMVANSILGHGHANEKPRLHKSILVPAAANLSTAYNLAVINYALMMIQHSYAPSSPEVLSTVVSCSLMGAIMGQLTFGYIGDMLGRRKGMILTLLLSIGGAIASAIVPWGEDTVYPLLAMCRFILGLGVGGVYPLSATSAVEASRDEVKNSKAVAVVFCFQGVGQLLAPFLAFVVLRLGFSHGCGWRIILAAGAIPGLIVLRQAYQDAALDNTPAGILLESAQSSLPDVVRRDASLVPKLIGAGLGWFLFDITFYGNVLFTPIILQDTFGYDGNHLKNVALCSLFVAAIALPGYFVTILAVGRVDFRTIQLMGFTMMAVLFFILGTFYETLLQQQALLLALYSLTFFFANFGPNVSTFCLPAELFPRPARVRLTGVAAASGKIGATVGAAVFGMIEKDFGVSQVLVLSGVVSLLGALVTFKFIPSKKYRSVHGRSVV